MSESPSPCAEQASLIEQVMGGVRYLQGMQNLIINVCMYECSQLNIMPNMLQSYVGMHVGCVLLVSTWLH